MYELLSTFFLQLLANLKYAGMLHVTSGDAACWKKSKNIQNSVDAKKMSVPLWSLQIATHVLIK